MGLFKNIFSRANLALIIQRKDDEIRDAKVTIDRLIENQKSYLRNTEDNYSRSISQRESELKISHAEEIDRLNKRHQAIVDTLQIKNKRLESRHDDVMVLYNDLMAEAHRAENFKAVVNGRVNIITGYAETASQQSRMIIDEVDDFVKRIRSYENRVNKLLPE